MSRAVAATFLAGLAALPVLSLAPAAASAAPTRLWSAPVDVAVDDGDGWSYGLSQNVDILTSPTGAVVRVRRGGAGCAGELVLQQDAPGDAAGAAPEERARRVAAAMPARPAWARSSYWPRGATTGTGLGLCLQLLDRSLIVQLSAPADAASQRLANQIALAARPPVDVGSEPALRGLDTSLPYVTDQPGKLRFFGGLEVAWAVSRGLCSYEFMMTVASVKPAGQGLQAVPESLPLAFPDVYEFEGTRLACAEVGPDAFVTLVYVDWNEATSDTLGSLIRAVRATHGAPVVSTPDATTVTLPRLGLSVDLATVGRWRVVPSERYGVDGGDALVSADTFRATSPHAVVVRRAPCSAGTTALSPAERSTLIPAQLPQPASVEVDALSKRWSLVLCASAGTISYEFRIVGEALEAEAPTLPGYRALLALLAVATGVVAPAPPPTPDPAPTPGRRAPRRSFTGQFGLYGARYDQDVGGEVDDVGGGWLGFGGFAFGGAGGVVGVGGAFTFDVELGYGDSIDGEARGGGGLALWLGPLVAEGVVGLGLNATGPAGELDLFAQAGAHLRLGGRTVAWAGAMRTLGVGSDQVRYEGRLFLPVGGKGVMVFALWREYAFIGGTDSEQTEGQARAIGFGLGVGSGE